MLNWTSLFQNLNYSFYKWNKNPQNIKTSKTRHILWYTQVLWNSKDQNQKRYHQSSGKLEIMTKKKYSLQLFLQHIIFCCCCFCFIQRIAVCSKIKISMLLCSFSLVPRSFFVVLNLHFLRCYIKYANGLLNTCHRGFLKLSV